MTNIPPEKLREALRQITGPTGKFPQGPLNEEDKGELALAVGTESGKVAIHFGTPVVWLALDPEQAILLGNTIISHAQKLKERVRDDES